MAFSLASGNGFHAGLLPLRLLCTEMGLFSCSCSLQFEIVKVVHDMVIGCAFK